MRETGRSGTAAYLVKRVVELGGRYFKVEFTNRRGAPDYLIGLLGVMGFFVETKRPKGRAKAHQLRRHKELREMGFEVYIATTKEEIDELLNEKLRAKTLSETHQGRDPVKETGRRVELLRIGKNSRNPVGT